MRFRKERGEFKGKRKIFNTIRKLDEVAVLIPCSERRKGVRTESYANNSFRLMGLFNLICDCLINSFNVA